jgi:hypothetical protein
LGTPLKVDTDVFAPFKNLKNHHASERNEDNNGFGLAICKEIVHILNGQIFYVSKEGYNIFEVYIPTILIKSSKIDNEFDEEKLVNSCVSIRFVEYTFDAKSSSSEIFFEVSRIINELVDKVVSSNKFTALEINSIDQWNVLVVDGDC